MTSPGGWRLGACREVLPVDFLPSERQRSAQWHAFGHRVTAGRGYLQQQTWHVMEVLSMWSGSLSIGMSSNH